MAKISIIIPVFNAERYLARCLSSILNHEYLIHEIILVDDCSCDESKPIIREFQKKHTCIKFYKSVGLGAGAARNLGVLKATGDFVWFIDADDYVAKDAVPKLVELLENADFELVMFGAEHCFLDGNRLYIPAISPDEHGFRHRFVRSGPGPWQFLIKKAWWMKNHFYFREGIIHEDMELLPILVLYTKKFASLEQPLYYYCENPSSVLHTSANTDKCLDIFPALKGLYTRFQDAECENTYAKDIEWFFIWNLLVDAMKDFQKSPNGAFGWAESRKMLNTYFPNWRSNPYLKRSPLKIQARIYYNYYRRPKV